MCQMSISRNKKHTQSIAFLELGEAFLGAGTSALGHLDHVEGDGLGQTTALAHRHNVSGSHIPVGCRNTKYELVQYNWVLILGV